MVGRSYCLRWMCYFTNDSIMSLQAKLSFQLTQQRDQGHPPAGAQKPAERYFKKVKRKCLISRPIPLDHRPDGQRAVSFSAVHLSLGHRVPPEVELPVEASVRHVGPSHIFKCVIADNVNDGTHHCSPTKKHDDSSALLFISRGRPLSHSSVNLGVAPPEPDAQNQRIMLWLPISYHQSHVLKATLGCVCAEV